MLENKPIYPQKKEETKQKPAFRSTYNCLYD